MKTMMLQGMGWPQRSCHLGGWEVARSSSSSSSSSSSKQWGLSALANLKGVLRPTLTRTRDNSRLEHYPHLETTDSRYTGKDGAEATLGELVYRPSPYIN